ncbi:DDE_Tnp_1_7 domain-containing protein [Trichonephila inaurata madagascariensis]|uniref:DDE_Tnp_1_7 domain-containing protein n=1 Tax=Trichonephila inaurata madagascariensis TaxID=2747483 RepID=A0A8X6X1Z0_9ARAC|nr:DDE_Tnp_1_7 domain-containing protein [Trichonephila inaurata madagascariensis]
MVAHVLPCYAGNGICQFICSFMEFGAYKELRENISSLEYRRCVTKGLFSKSKAQPKRKGRPKSNHNEQVFCANNRRKGNLSVSDDIRLENRGCHWPTFVSNQGQEYISKGDSSYGVPLCRDRLRAVEKMGVSAGNESK